MRHFGQVKMLTEDCPSDSELSPFLATHALGWRGVRCVIDKGVYACQAKKGTDLFFTSHHG